MADQPFMTEQKRFWNQWNASTREQDLSEVSLRQARIVVGWLTAMARSDLRILEVGCGAGWLCPQLLEFGKVTATDLSDEVLQRAQQRVPEVRFIAGDFMSLALGKYDVVVCLEVLSHVADQRKFIKKISEHVEGGGYFMLATQNRPVLEKYNNIPPPGAGQIRKWVDENELRHLLEHDFDVLELFAVTPLANKGVMRWVNSRLVNRPVRAIVGDRIERLKERMGLGWTLMALGRKKAIKTQYH